MVATKRLPVNVLVTFQWCLRALPGKNGVGSFKRGPNRPPLVIAKIIIDRIPKW